jgi:hypothetical protein
MTKMVDVPDDLGTCCTQSADEPADMAYTNGCEGTAVAIVLAKHCEPPCKGHPVCGPCYDRAVLDGHVWRTLYDERSTNA